MPPAPTSEQLAAVSQTRPMAKGVWVKLALDTDEKNKVLAEKNRILSELMAKQKAAVYTRLILEQKAQEEERVRVAKVHQAALRARMEELAARKAIQEAKEQQFHDKVAVYFGRLGRAVSGYQTCHRSPYDGLETWTHYSFKSTSGVIFTGLVHDLNHLLDRIAKAGSRERSAFAAWRTSNGRKPLRPRPVYGFDDNNQEERQSAIDYTANWQELWQEYTQSVIVPCCIGSEFERDVKAHILKDGIKSTSYEIKECSEYNDGSIWSDQYEYYTTQEEEMKVPPADDLRQERVHRAMLAHRAYKLYLRVKKVICLYKNESICYYKGTTSYEYVCQRIKRVSASLPDLDHHFPTIKRMPGYHLDLPFMKKDQEKALEDKSMLYSTMLSLFPVYGAASTVQIGEYRLSAVRSRLHQPETPNLAVAFNQIRDALSQPVV